MIVNVLYLKNLPRKKWKWNTHTTCHVMETGILFLGYFQNGPQDLLNMS